MTMTRRLQITLVCLFLTLFIANETSHPILLSFFELYGSSEKVLGVYRIAKIAE